MSLIAVRLAALPSAARPYMSSSVRSTVQWSMCSEKTPTFTRWPTNTVAMLLPAVPSSSSNVRIRALLCVLAHCTYPSRWFLAQVSPVDTEQSCISLHRFGTTNDTVGRLLKVVGNREKRRLLDAGISLKFTHGLCLRAYWPLV